MREKAIALLWTVCVVLGSVCAAAQNTGEPSGPIELARYEDEFSTVRIQPARMDTDYGIAVIFEGTDDLHYYAKPETAPSPGFELKIQAQSRDFEFGEPVFPKWSIFQDIVGKKVEVYVGRFTVFLPIKAVRAPTKTTVIDKSEAQIKISGIACTSMVCLPPFDRTLQSSINWTRRDSWEQVGLETTSYPDQASEGPSYPAWFALGLAFVAGLALNIMPCVWPVLPLIVMRIVEQAKQSRGPEQSEGSGSQVKRRSFAALRMTKQQSMGLAFCLGILLFFAALAGANIVLKTFYGSVLQWGDQFRSATFVAAMALLLVVLALFMFGVFTIRVPSSIAGKSGSGKGYSGAVGMGFLAAILSTPCSFGILAAAFAWAQAQPLFLATIAIMVIGVGMALPYGVLTSMPGLLKRLPRAGRWMELFKQTVGFVLLVIAVKLIEGLPQTRRMNILYFAIVLAFCVWMAGSWVGFNTKPSRRRLVRLVAVLLAVAAGWAFLPAPAGELISWQHYDADSVRSALEQQRPVLIEFTADWCLSCKAVEKVVYSRKGIAGLVEQKGVLAIKADTTDRDSPATLALKNIYNEPGVPVSMLFVPGHEEPVRLRGILFADQLKESLKKLPDK